VRVRAALNKLALEMTQQVRAPFLSLRVRHGSRPAAFLRVADGATRQQQSALPNPILFCPLRLYAPFLALLIRPATLSSRLHIRSHCTDPPSAETTVQQSSRRAREMRRAAENRAGHVRAGVPISLSRCRPVQARRAWRDLRPRRNATPAAGMSASSA